MIKQMTKQGEDFYPKTTTSAVIDEATGKTLAELLEELEARLNTLEGN